MGKKTSKKTGVGYFRTAEDQMRPQNEVQENLESHPGLALLNAIDPSDMIISGGELGIYSVPVSLSPDLEEQRDELEIELLRAQEIVGNFASLHGWRHHTADPFMHTVEIFDGQEAFIDALLALLERQKFSDDPDNAILLPDAVSAALEKDVLMAVSPAAYAMIYPQGMEENSYARLLAHEMAHRLHVRILGGDEDAMGPVWFYEGFAIAAAGQFSRRKPAVTPEEAVRIIRREARGDYRAYATVMEMVLQKKSLPELVGMAGKPGFNEKVVELLAGR